MVAVVALLVAGVVAGRFRLVPEGSATVLDAFVIRVALPGLILSVVPELEVGPDVVRPVAAAWGTVAALALTVLVLRRVATLDRRTTGTLLLVVPLANTSFLGFPAVEALLGRGALPTAVLYDQLGSFLALASYGAVVAGRFGEGVSPHWVGLARRVVRFPPFAALVVGAALISFPEAAGALRPVVDPIGAAVTPLAMFSIGLRLDLAGGGWRPGLLAGGLVLRLVAAPAVVAGVALLVSGSLDGWAPTLLETGMPPMVTAAVLAAESGLDGPLASRLAGVGVVASMATLPVLAAVVT